MAPKLRIRVHDPRCLGVGSDCFDPHLVPAPAFRPTTASASLGPVAGPVPRALAKKLNACAILAIGLIAGLVFGLALVGVILRWMYVNGHGRGHGFSPARFSQPALPRGGW